MQPSNLGQAAKKKTRPKGKATPVADEASQSPSRLFKKKDTTSGGVVNLPTAQFNSSPPVLVTETGRGPARKKKKALDPNAKTFRPKSGDGKPDRPAAAVKPQGKTKVAEDEGITLVTAGTSLRSETLRGKYSISGDFFAPADGLFLSFAAADAARIRSECLENTSSFLQSITGMFALALEGFKEIRRKPKHRQRALLYHFVVAFLVLLPGAHSFECEPDPSYYGTPFGVTRMNCTSQPCSVGVLDPAPPAYLDPFPDGTSFEADGDGLYWLPPGSYESCGDKSGETIDVYASGTPAASCVSYSSVNFLTGSLSPVCTGVQSRVRCSRNMFVHCGTEGTQCMGCPLGYKARTGLANCTGSNVEMCVGNLADCCVVGAQDAAFWPVETAFMPVLDKCVIATEEQAAIANLIPCPADQAAIDNPMLHFRTRKGVEPWHLLEQQPPHNVGRVSAASTTLFTGSAMHVRNCEGIGVEREGAGLMAVTALSNACDPEYDNLVVHDTSAAEQVALLCHELTPQTIGLAAASPTGCLGRSTLFVHSRFRTGGAALPSAPDGQYGVPTPGVIFVGTVVPLKTPSLRFNKELLTCEITFIHADSFRLETSVETKFKWIHFSFLDHVTIITEASCRKTGGFLECHVPESVEHYTGVLTIRLEGEKFCDAEVEKLVVPHSKGEFYFARHAPYSWFKSYPLLGALCIVSVWTLFVVWWFLWKYVFKVDYFVQYTQLRSKEKKAGMDWKSFLKIPTLMWFFTAALFFLLPLVRGEDVLLSCAHAGPLSDCTLLHVFKPEFTAVGDVQTVRLMDGPVEVGFLNVKLMSVVESFVLGAPYYTRDLRWERHTTSMCGNHKPAPGNYCVGMNGTNPCAQIKANPLLAGELSNQKVPSFGTCVHESANMFGHCWTSHGGGLCRLQVTRMNADPNNVMGEVFTPMNPLTVSTFKLDMQVHNHTSTCTWTSDELPQCDVISTFTGPSVQDAFDLFGLTSRMVIRVHNGTANYDLFMDACERHLPKKGKVGEIQWLSEDDMLANRPNAIFDVDTSTIQSNPLREAQNLAEAEERTGVREHLLPLHHNGWEFFTSNDTLFARPMGPVFQRVTIGLNSSFTFVMGTPCLDEISIELVTAGGHKGAAGALAKLKITMPEDCVAGTLVVSGKGLTTRTLQIATGVNDLDVHFFSNVTEYDELWKFGVLSTLTGSKELRVTTLLLDDAFEVDRTGVFTGINITRHTPHSKLGLDFLKGLSGLGLSSWFPNFRSFGHDIGVIFKYTLVALCVFLVYSVVVKLPIPRWPKRFMRKKEPGTKSRKSSLPFFTNPKSKRT